MLRGFTLIEILLSLSMMAVIAAFSLPVAQNYQLRSGLHVAKDTTAQQLRRAQSLSIAGEGDDTWGVAIQNGSVTLFKGSSYASRDTSYDEVNAIQTSITTSGISEVVFTRITGEPSTTGDINLESAASQTEIITVQSNGLIEW